MIIENNVSNEIIINKSKFITFLYKVKSEDEINNYLTYLKKEYKDATHICYAYILNEKMKCSDDGEPSKTAGVPILEVLRKNQLNYIVCFVIRYFGGIKLGSGGLIRAYANSSSLCLKKTKIIKLEKLLKIKIVISYEKNKSFLKIINEENILEKNFDTGITYIILISEKRKELLDSLNFSYEVLDENYF